MDYEKRYNEILDAARYWHSNSEGDIPAVLEEIFPELAESEDEKMREELIRSFKSLNTIEIWNGIKRSDILAWLEKQQGGKDKFTQQHSPKEDSNVNDETNAPTEYGKYVDECLNEAAKHFFSEGEDKYSVADLFYAGVRCGQSWIEKQGEQNPYSGVSISHDNGVDILFDKKLVKHISGEKQSEQKPYGQRKECLDCQFNYAGECKGSCAMKRSERKPADKVEPKFKVGDWILYSGDHYEGVRHITKIDENGYYIERNGLPHGIIPFNHEICMRLWSIEDAKDGDILNANGTIFIYRRHTIAYVYHYCGVNLGDEFVISENGNEVWNSNSKIYPATKSQRDLLFQKMHKAGYKWDAEKKELKLLITNGGDFLEAENCEQKPIECIKFSNEFENQISHLLASVLNREHEYNEGFVKYAAQSLLGYAKNELKPTEWSEEDNETLAESY